MRNLNMILLILTFGAARVFAQQSRETLLDANSFHDKLQSTKNFILLDVRTPAEYTQGFIESAQNLDYRSPDFQAQVGKLDKSKTYFVYCRSGARSGASVDYMRTNGFKEVYDLRGGIQAWGSNNFPLVTTGKNQPDKISSADFSKMVASGTVLIDFYARGARPAKKWNPGSMKLPMNIQARFRFSALTLMKTSSWQNS